MLEDTDLKPPGIKPVTILILDGHFTSRAILLLFNKEGLSAHLLQNYKRHTPPVFS